MIQRVFIENFKAIYRAANLPLQPFTVFIGNNGTGKSSIIEALKALQIAVTNNLNAAFVEWGGLDVVRNYNAFLPQEDISTSGFRKIFEPITVSLDALINDNKYSYQVRINLSRTGDFYVVEHEELLQNEQPVFIGEVIGNEGEGLATFFQTVAGTPVEFQYENNKLLIGLKGLPAIATKPFEEFQTYVENWQFLYLNAHIMGKPTLQNRLVKKVKLNADGSNIGDYLFWLRNAKGQEYLDSLIRKLRFVLPYVSDIQPTIQETFNREVEILMLESNENSKALPGWLMSSGTLRIMALLAMFDTPEPPSVLFIDEIENGLDPRTIGLLLSHIERETSIKEMQVVVTTHSPYFLDLVGLESIIVAEKQREGSTYHIPNDDASLAKWKEKFAPGKLYTMGNLNKD